MQKHLRENYRSRRIAEQTVTDENEKRIAGQPQRFGFVAARRLQPELTRL